MEKKTSQSDILRKYNFLVLFPPSANKDLSRYGKVFLICWVFFAQCKKNGPNTQIKDRADQLKTTKEKGINQNIECWRQPTQVLLFKSDP